MGAVDLDDGFDNPLFHLLHAVQLLIQDAPGFLGIDGLKVVVFPLDIHHDRQGPLGVAALLRRDLVGAGHSQVSSGPEADIVRQGPSGAGNKVGDALEASQLHAVACLVLILVLRLICGSAACEQALDHKLKEAVLSGELCAAAKGDFTDLVNRITLFAVLAGKAHMDVVFPQPAQKTDKAGVYLQDVGGNISVLFIKYKGRSLDGICENTAGMMGKRLYAVVQKQNRLFWGSECLIRAEYSIGTCGGAACVSSVFKIKYWHKSNSFRNHRHHTTFTGKMCIKSCGGRNTVDNYHRGL